MCNDSGDESELSRRLVRLLVGAFDALEEKGGIVRGGGDHSKPLFFPDGVGEISVSLTVNGESASIALASPPAPRPEFGIIARPEPAPPLGSAHPMDVDPLWAANPNSTYTIQVFEKTGSGPPQQLGSTQTFVPGAGKQRVNL